MPSPLGRRLGPFDLGDAVGQFERRLEALGQAGCKIRAHHDAIDHHADIVLELAVERRDVIDRVERPVDLEALKALLLEVLDLLAVFALAAPHHGGDEVEARARRKGQHPIHHLAHGLAFDRQAGCRRIRNADARPQKPHVVVDLGDGTDGRARILGRGLLLDRNGRRQSVDLVDVRLAHHLQELARIGRQRFDVAPLALRIDRIEGERGFSRPGQAGEHDQLVARDHKIDVLEVMLACAAHHDRPLAEIGRAEVPFLFGDKWLRGFRSCGLGHEGFGLKGKARGAGRPSYKVRHARFRPLPAIRPACGHHLLWINRTKVEQKAIGTLASGGRHAMAGPIWLRVGFAVASA